MTNAAERLLLRRRLALIQKRHSYLVFLKKEPNNGTLLEKIKTLTDELDDINNVLTLKVNND